MCQAFSTTFNVISLDYKGTSSTYRPTPSSLLLQNFWATSYKFILLNHHEEMMYSHLSVLPQDQMLHPNTLVI